MVPALLAKKGNGVVIEGNVAGPTLHGKHRMKEAAKPLSGHVFSARGVNERLRKTLGAGPHPVKLPPPSLPP